ncbi:MAG: type II toxin-antitoxin system HicA family toxin [Bacteroidota bacterium]
MTRLPVLSGQDVAKALAEIGYMFDHQRGSHIILRHKNPPHRRVTVPNHKEVARGTLRSIIREVGLSLDQFTELL